METDSASTGMICKWTDLVFEKEHEIELTGETFVLNDVHYCVGKRLNEVGNYKVERLMPVTDAARAFLAGLGT